MGFLVMLAVLGCAYALESLYHACLSAAGREADRAQEQLLQEAMSVADRHVRRYHLDEDEREDLKQDCRIALWRGFVYRTREAGPMSEQQLVAYVRSIVARCVAEYFREKRPEWTRMKNKLRHLARKAEWIGSTRHDSTGQIGGCWLANPGDSATSSPGSMLPVLSGDAARRFRDDYYGRHRHAPDELSFPHLVRALLGWIGRPVSMDALVNCLMELLNVREGLVSLDEEYMRPAEGAT